MRTADERGERGDVEMAVRRSADDRFRASGRRRLVIGLVASVALHVAAFALLSVTRAGDLTASGESPDVVVLPPLDRPLEPAPPFVSVPPSAPPIRRPAEPVPASLAEVEAEPPEWIPHDVPPRLMNTGEVVDFLTEESRLTEIGERVVVLWIFVDRAGRPAKLQLRRSSGIPAVDAAAQEVAGAMRFSPALFQGRPVAVWIVQAIRFEPGPGDATG